MTKFSLQNSHSGRKARRSFNQNTDSTPRPMMVRGILTRNPMNQQAQPLVRRAAHSNPRRAFYVPVGPADSGAEMRLPAIPLVNPGWRSISALVVGAMLFLIFSVWNSPFFRVDQVSIQGLERISREDLNNVIHLNDLMIIEVNPEQVKTEIALAFPELADVQVEVELPNYVNVSARERQPLLSWQKGDQIYWIDSDGVIFPVRGEAAPLVTILSDDDIPLAMVPVAGQLTPTPSADSLSPAGGMNRDLKASFSPPTYLNRRADMKILNASLQLAKRVPEGTQIVYHKENGMGWNDAAGWQVYIGKDLQNFETKLNTYQAIVRHLQDQGIQPEIISVEHLNAPFYRAPKIVQEEPEGTD